MGMIMLFLRDDAAHWRSAFFAQVFDTHKQHKGGRMSYKLTLALTALVVVMLGGCKDPVGMPNHAHAATTYTTYCTVLTGLEPTGRLEWWQTTLGLPVGYFWWYDGTIKVGYHDGGSGRNYPRINGVCFFQIPPFDCSGGVPACTLYYYQNSHTQSGEGESFLVNWWNSTLTRWPPADYTDRYNAFWAIWNSTDTLAIDVIHADDGWQKVPLETLACATIGDSGAWYYANDPNGYAAFKTGWVYYGSASDSYTWIAGYDDAQNHRPYIKVVYDGP